MKALDDMAVFVRVVELASLSAAGRDLRLSPAVVSNRIAKLERRLGVRLLNRTTRQVQATDEGRAYYEHCLRILEAVEQAESSIAALRQAPKGVLKVTAPAGFGRLHIAPLIPRFVARHPEVQVRLRLADELLNLVEDGLDVAIRIADLEDSSLIARRLAPNRRVVCAAPAYLARHGAPRTPMDLLQHNCLLLRFPGSRQFQWTFRTPSGPVTVPVSGTTDSNNGEVLRQWALDGQGLALKSTWEIRDDLLAGRLVPVLRDHPPAETAIHAVYPYSRYVPPKVRTFVDFVAEALGPDPSWDRGLSV